MKYALSVALRRTKDVIYEEIGAFMFMVYVNIYDTINAKFN